MARIGIMGGTFDPIHYGHLVTAEEARFQFALDHVYFVPNRYPPHKSLDHVTDPEHRFRMTQLAVQSNPRFSVSRIEIDRPGPSYTIDTLLALRREYAAGDLFYITGADAILQIVRGEWQRAAELLELCQFIAASRPGFPIGVDDLRRYNVTGRVLENLHVMEIPALAISSTDIRARVAAGRPIRYLVPDAVAAYIAEHGLYRRPGTPLP
ncbi:MAG: nicotinate-nucleotide adenylyltransferase [Armatimonadota bacterium]|nr:nicotinate-nucleotide adenylyltransferase [Armatimonadota bacterium]MDR7450476.1 nicotinate-nucleotide adenylyltransferase [Armatimonadota bacterium]MDR7466941.1 nicotinate-nucleotide adenylyltransferase [Armatimonadota bacterium]MDR7493517.1 nicotinate-nucleotide adenylyltransferase [Armatimonadota bacterium]MDR7498782.1 nicotinate-nucleotide adenylyltransferase [Armatimonadota bacterium]